MVLASPVDTGRLLLSPLQCLIQTCQAISTIHLSQTRSIPVGVTVAYPRILRDHGFRICSLPQLRKIAALSSAVFNPDLSGSTKLDSRVSNLSTSPCAPKDCFFVSQTYAKKSLNGLCTKSRLLNHFSIPSIQTCQAVLNSTAESRTCRPPLAAMEVGSFP
jgi:hypothetical protein